MELCMKNICSGRIWIVNLICFGRKMICRGGWYCSRSYKSICRSGWCSQTAPINRFVGAATVPTAPTVYIYIFKKIQIYNSNLTEHIFFMHNSIMTYLLLRLYWNSNLYNMSIGPTTMNILLNANLLDEELYNMSIGPTDHKMLSCCLDS